VRKRIGRHFRETRCKIALWYLDTHSHIFRDIGCLDGQAILVQVQNALEDRARLCLHGASQLTL
jgi:hypothetical protein